jgi:hypothetical protein
MDRRTQKDDHPKNVRVLEPEAATLGRTALGRRLRELRRLIVADGKPLLDIDDIEKEMQARGHSATGDDPFGRQR